MPVSMVFPKNSSLRHIFNYYIFKMRETGAHDKVLRTYDLSPPDCDYRWEEKDTYAHLWFRTKQESYKLNILSGPRRENPFRFTN